MFDFLSFKRDVDSSSEKLKFNKVCGTDTNIRRSSSFLVAIVLGASLLAGCQQQSISKDNTLDSTEQATQETEIVTQSESAAAHIKQLQPVYVKQMQSLQRRLQAEYESLQAADMIDSDSSLLPNNNESTNINNPTAINSDPSSNVERNVGSSAVPDGTTDINSNTVDTNLNTADTEDQIDLTSSTEVGERDLTVLRRISAEPREPTILTERQIIKSYQQTIDALYQPISEPLNSEQTDTLINIAALIPQLFEHTELADRLNAKSPALARLIVQHQVWEQIEARQASYMQEMKVTQQQEFESLMTKFNETIKDYDEQIAKYEQTLKEFE